MFSNKPKCGSIVANNLVTKYMFKINNNNNKNNTMTSSDVTLISWLLVLNSHLPRWVHPQQTDTCLKSTIETIKIDMKYVQS